MKRHQILAFFLLFVGVCVLHSPKLYAKTLKADAATEKVAIAFYKTGNIIPNFDRWIKGNAPYNVTPWALRPKTYDREMQRLQKAYLDFDPKTDYLIVRTKSFLKPTEIIDAEGQRTYAIGTEFVEAPEALYFPYNFLDERIVLMPYHLQDMMQDDISKRQYDYIRRHTNTKSKLTTIIRMKPDHADFSKPYKIDGMEQWVFKTRIATIEIWNKNNDLVWEYTAPWYVSPHILEIKNLHQNRDKDIGITRGLIKPTPQ